jgi:hypothetical protein
MTTPVDPFAAMEARRAEQIAEYGTYVAGEQVFIAGGGALAYDVGHPIPASNVDPKDLSVVNARHYCPPQLPGLPECPIPNNEVLSRTEPGVAIKVTQDAPAKAAAKQNTKES